MQPRLPALLAPLAVSVALSAQPIVVDITALLSSVGHRVEEYYNRAQSIVCTQRVTMQPIRSDMTPEGFARVLEYELRVDWDPAADGGEPQAHLTRELKKVNGRTPKPKDEPPCGAPTDVSPEPLAMLLPHHREEYTFSLAGPGKWKDHQVLMMDFKTKKAPGKAETKWKEDCLSFEVPVQTRGRIWVDAGTHDVLRRDEGLAGPFDIPIPREHSGSGQPTLWTFHRMDSTVRYKQVAFREPEETVLVPESIETLLVVSGGAESYRRSESFSSYRRFMTGGRILQ